MCSSPVYVGVEHRPVLASINMFILCPFISVFSRVLGVSDSSSIYWIESLNILATAALYIQLIRFARKRIF